jgi:chromosome segregation ATPase
MDIARVLRARQKCIGAIHGDKHPVASCPEAPRGNVSRSLTPNKVAVVAEVEEEWTAHVDTRMESLGGTVHRRALWDVQKTLHEEEIGAMNADLKQLKSEISEAHADRRVRLQKKIDQLEAKVDALLWNAKQHHEAFEARQESKRHVLKENAAAAGRALKKLAHTPV